MAPLEHVLGFRTRAGGRAGSARRRGHPGLGKPERRAREEVVEIVEGRQLSYVLRFGMPFRDYRANVRLEPQTFGGAAILWQAHFNALSFGPRWFWKLFMRWVLGSTARRLAKTATDASILSAARTNIATSHDLVPTRP